MTKLNHPKQGIILPRNCIDERPIQGVLSLLSQRLTWGEFGTLLFRLLSVSLRTLERILNAALIGILEMPALRQICDRIGRELRKYVTSLVSILRPTKVVTVSGAQDFYTAK